MCGMFNLNVWDNEATYLVLDDIDFEYIPNRKALWGSQKEMTLTDKFKHKRSVQWNKPMIVLQNEGWDFRDLTVGGRKSEGGFRTVAEREWYLENSVIVEIKEPMWRAEM